MTDTEHCLNCRWWSTNDMSAGDGYGVCLYASYSCYGTGAAGAYAADGRTGYLKTRQDFGCVQFERRGAP